jgi:hypothetical protein
MFFGDVFGTFPRSNHYRCHVLVILAQTIHWLSSVNIVRVCHEGKSTAADENDEGDEGGEENDECDEGRGGSEHASE